MKATLATLLILCLPCMALAQQSTNSQSTGSSNQPKIWVTTPAPNGATVIAPGTHQPVTETQTPRGTHYDFDHAPAPNSTYEVIDTTKKK
jgi:hypothetical protein